MQWKWVAELPSVNYKVLIGSSMFVGFCVTCFVCMVRAIALSEGLVLAVGGIILAYNGVTSYDFKTKRETYISSPPAGPDREDAKAGATAPGAAPGTIIEDAGNRMQPGAAQAQRNATGGFPAMPLEPSAPGAPRPPTPGPVSPVGAALRGRAPDA